MNALHLQRCSRTHLIGSLGRRYPQRSDRPSGVGMMLSLVRDRSHLIWPPATTPFSGMNSTGRPILHAVVAPVASPQVECPLQSRGKLYLGAQDGTQGGPCPPPLQSLRGRRGRVAQGSAAVKVSPPTHWHSWGTRGLSVHASTTIHATTRSLALTAADPPGAVRPAYPDRRRVAGSAGWRGCRPTSWMRWCLPDKGRHASSRRPPRRRSESR